jgi:photosystem I subunit XI
MGASQPGLPLTNRAFGESALPVTDCMQLGPLRNVPGTAEVAGCLSGAGLVLILSLCLSLYGAAQFQSTPAIGVKTLTGRAVPRDPLQSAEG